MLKNEHLYIYSEIFIECLICVRVSSSYLDYCYEQYRQISCSPEACIMDGGSVGGHRQNRISKVTRDIHKDKCSGKKVK